MYLNDRGGDLFGILNGIDYRDFDSTTDKFLPAHFSAEDLSGKAECKRALQERMGLWQDPSRCMIGLVSRFVSGKGLDLVQGMMERALTEMHVQAVFLGSGDPAFHQYLADLQARFPGRVANWIGYDEGLAHQIYAGSDLYLMPSGYEPCGLSQLYAMRYGSLPVVRRTGGLADTVWNYQEWDGGGDGFVFEEYRAESLYYTLGWAVSTFFDRKHHFAAMQRRAMQPTFSWERTVPEYEKVYEHALKRVRG
jgi:starch synthase